MPIRSSTLDLPNKRPRIEEKRTQHAMVFTTASQIHAALRSENPGGMTEALTSLRNQLTLKSHEISVPPHDERLVLAKTWMESSSPGAQELLGIWDKASLRRESSTIALVLSTLSSILLLLSSHYTDHALGQSVMKALLAPSRLRQLNSYIGGSHNELIIVTLKLYNVMSDFAGGRDRKAVLAGFGWEIKSLPKLLNMRRKGNKTQDLIDPLIRPDIRTLYVLLLLSFLDVNGTAQIKTAFLEQHRDAFHAIFKGIAQDHYSLARKILEVCWAGIWCDGKVKRTIKVALFNETTLGHLLKLYERVQPEDADEEHIPANLVHHFLLAICTRPGIGICFKDRGWYPRETDPDDFTPKDDEDDGKRRPGKIYNKILANVLKTLKVNEDSRQQELASKVLSACPELIAGYWSSAALTLEPRLSSKWITNVAFFGNIIALPPPTPSFYVPNTHLYQPSPPPLYTIIENILPSVNTKTNFSRGLQSPSGLVQHCTALALSKCLTKFQSVLEQFKSIAAALEEDDEDGQWSKRCRELEREVRRRVPEFQVVVALSQRSPALTPGPGQSAQGQLGQANETRNALMAESAQRLLWLYHRCLPSIVAEARFDVGKLLQTFAADGPAPAGDQTSDAAASRLYRVQQMHVLSMLKDSDQFVWAGKVASLSNTPFYVLLDRLAATNIPALRKALAQLLQHILSKSVLFQEDPHEPELWLKALPRKQHISTEDTSGMPDPRVLEDESEGVISFLDDCVQRCLKAPYRYVELLHSFASTSSSSINANANASTLSEGFEMYPSPLLMTVTEQLEAKLKTNALAPSHLIGILCFIRKLVFYLTSKVLDLQLLRAYASKVETILSAQQQRWQGDSEQLVVGVRREVALLRASLTFSAPPPDETQPTVSSMPEYGDYLSKIEQNGISEDTRSRMSMAFDVVNRVRTFNDSPSTEDLRRLVLLIAALDPSAIPSLLEHLNPAHVDIWLAMDLPSKYTEYRPHLTFEWLYFHTSRQQIVEEDCQAILCDAIFTHAPSFVELVRAVCVIQHGISASREEDIVLGAHLSLLSRVLRASKDKLLPSEFDALKEVLFVRPNVVKDILLSTPPMTNTIRRDIENLLEGSLDAGSSTDRKLVFDISNHWFNILKMDIDTESSIAHHKVDMACIWIKYLEDVQLFDLLEFLQSQANNMPTSTSVTVPINAILHTLASTASLQGRADSALSHHLPRLLALQPILPESSLLEQVVAIAVDLSLPMGLDGNTLSLPPSRYADFASVIKRARARWDQRLPTTRMQMNVQQYLGEETLSDSTVKVVSGLLYQRAASREVISQWMKSVDCLKREMHHTLPIIHAYIDTFSSLDGTTPSLTDESWSLLLSKLVAVVSNKAVTPNEQRQARDCLMKILSTSTFDPSQALEALASELNRWKHDVNSELLLFGTSLAHRFASKANFVSSVLVDRGMQMVIDRLAEESERTDLKGLTQSLTCLVKASSVSKSHLVETLLSVIIQHHISSSAALRLATASLASCQLKPVVVNRHLQSLVQHPSFFKLCAWVAEEGNGIRNALIELLHCLFSLHPNNTCQITHIEPLIRIYRGTLAPSDLRLLSIFQLFETQRKLSVAALLARWSATSNTTSATPLEALQSLDSIMVLRTCLNFPQWRHADDHVSAKVDAQASELYDPVFLALLFSRMIAEQPPSSAFAWVELFRTNIVSLFIRSMSAKDGQIRELGLCQLVALWRQLETADMQEKPHVQYILNLLKDLLPNPTIVSSSDDTHYPRRLPTYTTLLLMHSMRGIFNPTNFVYPLTARFLLQRPSLDASDVPMLYGLLYSSSDDNWKKERAWIIKFLADGMVGSEDWKVLKRRHTWDLLESLFQSSESDTALRLGILEVLANLTCNAQATTSLVLKSGLLPWIEMQLLTSGIATINAEGVEWIKIFENVLVILDADKVDLSTNGEWRAIICRCLTYLLDDKRCSSTAENFPHAVPVILRLASLKGRTPSSMTNLLRFALQCLEKWESRLELPSGVMSTAHRDNWNSENIISVPPHRSSTLHQRLQIEPSSPKALLVWGKLLEMLWQSSMMLDSSGRKKSAAAWDALTPRMLLWRSFVDADYSPTAEWVRKEVVSSLRVG